MAVQVSIKDISVAKSDSQLCKSGMSNLVEFMISDKVLDRNVKNSYTFVIQHVRDVSGSFKHASTKMDNFSNMYYVFRLIVEEIFVYLRDIILYEFGWLGADYEHSKSHETRVQQTIFTHPMADFAALFIICIFLGICVLLSSKPSKDAEECLLVDELNRVNLPEDRTYKLPATLNTDIYRAARGDASSEAGLGFTPVYDEELEHPSARESPVESTLYNVHHTHSQSTQTTSRALRRAAGAREWLIRRTRSGHVYGKYPM